MKLLLLLTVFWTMQILANIAFKWGSGGGRTRTHRWWLGFIAGNAVGASSIWFLMQVYALLPDNSNLAAVLASGGGFIGSQLLLAWLFRSRLTPLQWCGIALVAVGTAVATLSGARYDAVEKTLYLQPTIKGDFRAFLCTATGYGTVGVRKGKAFLEVAAGTIPVKTIDYKPFHL